MTFALCGALAESFGWEWDFYLFAILSLVFSLAWIGLIFNQPAEHPRITQAEKDYLEKEMGLDKPSLRKKRPPYFQIVKSVPFWALVMTFVASSWGFYTLETEIPTYLNNIQHIPLTYVNSIKPLRKISLNSWTFETLFRMD